MVSRDAVLDEAFVSSFTEGFQKLIGNNQMMNTMLTAMTDNLAGKTLDELPAMFANITNNGQLFSALNDDPKFSMDNDITNINNTINELYVNNNVPDNVPGPDDLIDYVNNEPANQDEQPTNIEN